MGIVNNQGGPVRAEDSQMLDKNKQPAQSRDSMKQISRRKGKTGTQRGKNNLSDSALEDRSKESVHTTIEKESSFSGKMQMAVTAILLAVYVTTMHPSLPGGDAGEIIVAANELGVAHPPGYPLYTLMLKTFFVLVPYGTVAWRANLLTSILAAAAGSFLYQAVFLMSNSIAAGLLAAGMFSFSRLTWAWSVTAEVFALNNLLVAVLLLVAVYFSQSKAVCKVKVAHIGALVCGLCLSNQHTTVVYIAVLVPWVFCCLYLHKVLSVRLVVQLSLCFLLGLLPYAYLPLSSVWGQARWTWGDQSTVSGFLIHLLRREYGTLHLLKDHEGQGLIPGFLAYMEHVAKDLTPAILFFFAVTVFSIYRRRRHGCCEMMLVMLLMLTTYTFFFAWRANLDIEKPLFRGVVERFWMQSDLILVAMAAVAFSDVSSLVNRMVPVLKYHLELMVAVVLVAMQLAINITACDQTGNRVVEEFALTTLKAFPSGAVVLTKGDLPSNSLRYYHLTEGVRPDITLFDQEVLTYDWSIPMLGHHSPGLHWPGQQMHLSSGINAQGIQLFTFKQLLDAHYGKKPIFGCIGVQDHEPSWEAAYDLRPFGACMQFVKKGSKLKLEDWLKSSHRFAANWTHPIPVTEYTWEDVASGEMWRAKTMAGLYLLQSADTLTNKEEIEVRLRHAYKVYREAIESHPHIPGYWHKNFALVCEKLRHVAPPSETVSLLRTTIAHFKAYLDSGTSDPQAGAIEEAVGQLQQYLDFISKTEKGGGR